MQFNTSDVQGHNIGDHGDLNRDWKGIQKGALTSSQNRCWEAAAPIQPESQNYEFDPALQMTTPRLRPLPQNVADRAAVSNANGAFAEAGASEVEGSPSIPPELMNLLSWQNEQLRRLQDQVKLWFPQNVLEETQICISRSNSF